MIVRRVEALGKFLESEDGKNLLAGTRRAANILRAEEKGGERFADPVDAHLLKDPAESVLFDAVNEARSAASAAISREDFGAAMAALAKLRPAVDTFFDKVLVNAPEPALRQNRLRLLNQIREATAAVADFSKIAG